MQNYLSYFSQSTSFKGLTIPSFLSHLLMLDPKGFLVPLSKSLELLMLLSTLVFLISTYKWYHPENKYFISPNLKNNLEKSKKQNDRLNDIRRFCIIYIAHLSTFRNYHRIGNRVQVIYLSITLAECYQEITAMPQQY